MKNKILKKLMIFGLVCSMSLTMVPTTVMAAGMQTESETRQAEETQTEKPQAETKAMIKLPDETEQPTTKNAAESESNAAETPQSETKSSEAASKETSAKETEQPTASGAVEEILDQPGRAPRAAEAGELLIEGGEEGKDYTYDADNKIYTIQSNTPLTISGESGWEYEDKIVVDVAGTDTKQAHVILSGVVLKRGSGSVLEVKKGSKLDLTLEWENRFTVEGNNAAAVVLEADTELAIGGSGKLAIEVPQESLAKDISMSRGNKTEDGKAEGTSSLKITDGTVIAKKGIAVTGNASSQRVSVQISGGSVDLAAPNRSAVSVTNDKRVNVYKKIIQLTKADVQVGDLSVMHEGKEYTYGCQGIYKNADKEIFLYLPAGKAAVTAEQSEYSGNVTQDDEDNKRELTKTKAELSVGETGKVTLPELEYGYTSADIKEVPVTIQNMAANATNVTVEFATGQSKYFELTQKSAMVPAKTSAGAGVNEEIKIRLKTTGLDAGTYTDGLKLTGEDGSTKQVEITFTVKKAKITLTSKNVKIDSKVYDGKKAATGTISLPEINGRTPEIDTDKVVFKFNSANVKEATSVTVSNLKLTETWENNYELAGTELEVPVKNKIKKAPNKHTKDELKKPSVTTVYVKSKGVWQPQLTTYKGQEYLFFGSSHTSLTAKNEKSENWKFGDKKSTVKDRLVTIEGGLKSGATYTVWTRFAGDDNHEPSEATVAADYTVFTAGQNNGGGTDANGNKINGLTEGTTYKTGSRLAFGAVGAGMSNTSPKEGDERYLPISWKVSEEHTWSSSPYEAAFTINQAGSYTLQVTFRKQTYTNGSWTNTSSTSVSKVNFKMASTGTDGTGYNTSSSTSTTPTSGTGSSTSSTGKTTTSTAAKTGDQSPVLPMAVIFLASAAVLAGYLWKKKSQVKE